MKHIKRIIKVALSFALAFIFLQGHVCAGSFIQEFIVMSPGEKVQRNFFLNDVIDLQSLSPVQNYSILTLGEAETLSIEMSIDPELNEFEALVEFGFSGIAYSPQEGPLPVVETAETPFSAETDIALNAEFGFATVGAMIMGYRGDIDLPIPCTFTFRVLEPGAEEDHEENGHDDDDHDEDEHDGEEHDHE